MNQRFVGTVKKGALILSEPARWRGMLAHHEGKRLAITVARETQRRSLKANAYLWGVVYPTIAEWCGHDSEELHDVFKAMFLAPRELLLPTGELMNARGSTAVLDLEQFSEYVSKVKRWAAEQGVYVPEPDQMEAAL